MAAKKTGKSPRRHESRRARDGDRGSNAHDPSSGNGHGLPASEDRRSLAVTVAWMMATLATAVAFVLFVVAFGVIRALTPADVRASPLALLPQVLLFTSVVTGSLVLLLIPVVHRVRVTAPPRVVSIVAGCIGVGPWLVLVADAIF